MDLLMLYFLVFIIVLLFISVILFLFFMKMKTMVTLQHIQNMKEEISHEVGKSIEQNNEVLQANTKHIAEMFSSVYGQNAQVQDKRLQELRIQFDQFQKMLYSSVNDSLINIQRSLNENAQQNEQKLENIRMTVEQRLTHLQNENTKKLEEMRMTVDEKLQQTLEDRISKSFTMVSERLEQVYKGLGEMQTLAIGVGDLKKVLSNVKTRGILGEIQLGAILEEILSIEQYEKNVITKKGTQNYVEYAVKLPADDNRHVYLPIDSKFPAETYAKLIDAYDSGDTALIHACEKQLITCIKQEAKDIRDKYIEVPMTTDFAIMFLPFEGLYAEVVKRGLVEVLQREYKINIAGPTTMAALLNSLQMGFKTLAIQKRSGEVWDILGAVKSEFNKFGEVLEGTQLKMEQAQKELDRLVGVRTRQIQRKLKTVTELESSQSIHILED